MLHDVYAHCIDGQDDIINQQIEDALDPATGTRHVSQCGKQAVMRTAGTAQNLSAICP